MTEKKKVEHPNLFDFFNQLYFKKRTYPYDKKIANAYLMLMWLSHDQQLMPLVHKINRLQWYIPDDIIYEYLMDTVPRGKRFVKWTKKTPASKKKDKKIQELMEETGLSKKEILKVWDRIED